MSTDHLPWHDALWIAVRDLRRLDRLPHALMLCGPSGLGKTILADRIAAALVCRDPDGAGNACERCSACHTRKAGTHPDLKRIAPEESGKPIGIDAIREATSRSVLTAEAAGYKVFIFNPADRLTHGAANALLKTLEEPTRNTLILLVTARPESLPATIRSRCQQLRVCAPDNDTAKIWLTGQDGGDRALAVLDLAGGAPLLALAMARDGAADIVVSMCNDLNRLVDQQTNPITLAAQWQKHDLEFVLRYLSQWTIDLIRLKTLSNPPLLFDKSAGGDLHRLAQRLEFKRLFQFWDDIAATKLHARHNLNVQLTLEHHLTVCSQLTIQ